MVSSGIFQFGKNMSTLICNLDHRLIVSKEALMRGKK